MDRYGNNFPNYGYQHQFLTDEEGLTFIRFYDVDCQCLTCRNFACEFEFLCSRFGQSAKFLEASAQSNPYTLGQLNIAYLPTVVAFWGRREIARYAGDCAEQLKLFVQDMFV